MTSKQERPLDRVGDDEAYVVLAEELDELRGGEGLVADLDGVAERQVVGGFQAGACRSEHAFVASFGQPAGGAGGAREQLEEGGEAGGVVEAQLGRELPQDRAELWAEGEDARGEEVGDGGLDVDELAHVRDEAAAFEGEDEVVGVSAAQCRK